MTGSILYDALMQAGGLFCHQLPERSPHLWATQLPLCWRCAGVAVGAFALFAYLVARKRLPPLWLSTLLALALPLEVLYSSLAGGANPRRLATGLLFGFFASAAALELLRRLAARRAPLNDEATTNAAAGELAR